MKENIVILTGAGISAESGIKTFRDSNGLWENHAIEDVATPEGFARNPALVYRFYNARRAQLHDENVVPNLGHKSLAQLEQHDGFNVAIITQNVDNLHERAGSKKVLHMHGELLSALCRYSNQRTYYEADFDESTECSCCHRSGGLRPDIVWFGEIPMYMDEIQTLIEQANHFVAIGTSGQVYPAAGFVNFAKQLGITTTEINLEPSDNNYLFDHTYVGPASEAVPRFVSDLITNKNN